MDKGKEKVSVKQIEGTNILRFKRTKTEDTSDGQKKEDTIERAIRLQDEDRLRKMKMDAVKEEEETTEDSIDKLLKEELEGTETEYSAEEEKTALSELEVFSKPVYETVVSTSEEEEEDTILSPKESSTNNPKGLKMNVEQPAPGNNQDEQLTPSPEEALKNKQVIEEEEEEYEEIEIVDSLSDDTLSDACTRKLPTSPIDKFMDSDKDKSMRSPPGDDQGL